MTNFVFTFKTFALIRNAKSERNLMQIFQENVCTFEA